MDPQPKPVLVVGGTGFLGRQVVAELVARGKAVRALVRPCAFLDQILLSMPGGGVANGRLVSFWSRNVALTFVLTADVAGSLAAAVDAPGIVGEHIDLGWDQPVTMRQLADMLTDQLGRPVKVRSIPGPIMTAGLTVVGRLLRDSGLTPEPAG